MCQALLEIMQPEIDAIVGEAKKETVEKVTREVTKEVTKEVTREVTKEVTREVTKEVTRDLAKATARKMLDAGKFTTEEIHEYVPWLSIEEIQQLES